MTRERRMKKQKHERTAQVIDGAPLEVNGLYKKYDKKSDYAVKNISFTCNRGEILGILGANGAGKSTTLKCITGMIPLSEGKITIAGYDIEKNPVEAKRRFSFVTDNHTVFQKMTGTQYLSFMADVYGVPTEERQAKYESLEKVFRLGDSVKKLISGYSHGMKQKICMMGSLMHDPELWILDEPMLGLDPRTQNAVISFMRDYVKNGKTILFSSHNLDIVRRICDRTIIIASGEIVTEIDLKNESRDNDEIIDAYYDCEKAENE